MRRFKQNLVLAAAFTVLVVTGVFMNSRQAGAQNPTSQSGPAVTIAAPLPLPVTGTVNVVESAVKTPFQEFLRNDIAGRNSFTVGSNQRATIEFVTSECSIQTTGAVNHAAIGFELRTTVGTSTVFHNFHPRFSRTLAVGQLTNFYYGSTDTTRIYADPGTTVSITGILVNFVCFVNVSGYTVPS